jgi:hypothetical protein
MYIKILEVICDAVREKLAAIKVIQYRDVEKEGREANAHSAISPATSPAYLCHSIQHSLAHFSSPR